MTDTDPLVPVLAGLVVDVVWFLDSCEDDEVDPDSAVKMMESVGWVLGRLPQDQRDRFLTVLADLAEAETEPGRREFLEAFPSPAAWLRLSQAEPNPDQAQVPGCRLTTGAPRWRRLACSASPARAPAGRRCAARMRDRSARVSWGPAGGYPPGTPLPQSDNSDQRHPAAHRP